MVDEEDLAALLELHLPAGGQRLARVGEQVEEADQLLVVLVLLVVGGRVGADLLQHHVQAAVLLEQAARLAARLHHLLQVRPQNEHRARLPKQQLA